MHFDVQIRNKINRKLKLNVIQLHKYKYHIQVLLTDMFPPVTEMY